ncbi:MAG: DUF3021 domain-containing protein [Defluviitaleaceae bacterium]|nr:DUF3021 domain-containing protein [Defluviitaleaceae bacterium]
MKKKAVLRGLLGVPLGIAMGFVVSIIISLAMGDGYFVPVVPEMAELFTSELNAVMFNVILYAVLGGSFAAASVIWEMEDWSIARQTITHFVISATTMMPVAWFGHWMERTLMGFIIYFAVFILIFAKIWVIQYLIWRKRINGINQKVNQ